MISIIPFHSIFNFVSGLSFFSAILETVLSLDLTFDPNASFSHVLYVLTFVLICSSSGWGGLGRRVVGGGGGITEKEGR